MVVIILEKVKPSLHGELSRWMIEPHTGVFVGTISAMVREKLWEKICSKSCDGACLMLWKSDTEQGFKVNFWGNTSRYITDWEGLQLATKPFKL